MLKTPAIKREIIINLGTGRPQPGPGSARAVDFPFRDRGRDEDMTADAAPLFHSLEVGGAALRASADGYVGCPT